MKSLLTPLTDPLALLWLVMVLGTLDQARRKQWRTALWFGIPVFLVYLIGSTPLVSNVVENMERPYAVTNLAALPAVDAVVALGGGQKISKHDPLGFSVGEAGDRNLAAIKLVRLNKAKALVLGGGYENANEPGASVMSIVRQWIAAWDLVNVPVVDLGICKDTHDEALAFKKLCEANGWRNALLVTSALHMKRSEALFKKQGLDVIPVAADFQVYGTSKNSRAFTLFPSTGSFELLSLYLHEEFGWYYYKLRGWL